MTALLLHRPRSFIAVCRRGWAGTRLGMLILAACCLTACGDDRVGASVSGYNHMPDWFIAGFSVGDGSGPPVSPESGGGKYSCCVSIPKRWYPGMKVKVEWRYDTIGGGYKPPPQEAEVEIPEYTKRAGTVQVHFYPEHKVKVVVTSYGIGHPRYPMSEQDKLPWATRADLLEAEKQGALTE